MREGIPIGMEMDSESCIRAKRMTQRKPKELCRYTDCNKDDVKGLIDGLRTQRAKAVRNTEKGIG